MKNSNTSYLRIIHQTGFTLIEVLIVVAILGILAAIAIPAYNNYIITSKQGVARSVIEQFPILIETYRAETGSMCPGCNPLANGVTTFLYSENDSGVENTVGNKITTAFPDFKRGSVSGGASLYHYQVTFTTAGCPANCSQSAVVTAIPQANRYAPPGNIVSNAIQ